MITAFRRYLDSWVVRGFFLIMILAFVFWGVGDVVRMVGTSTWVAQVGGQNLEAPAVQAEFQKAMAQATRDLPAGQDATVEMRRRVGNETVQRMVAQAALSQELHNLRIVAPDTAVADMARTMPVFRGPDGKFSKAVFDQVLRSNGLTEARFLDMLRGDLAQRQLLSAIGAGVFAPSTLVETVYAAEFQKRVVELVEFPIAAAAEPATPDDKVLERWYDNHHSSYMTPEFRRITAITLTPQKVGQDIEVSESELKDAFERTKSAYGTFAKRSAQVISVTDEAKAAALAEKWRGGADWAAMQAAAQEAGGAGVALDDATESQFPDPDLSKAVFAAAPDAVAGPVKGALGWYVLKVTAATPGSNPSLEEVKDQVKERLIADKAADMVYDRANKVDSLLANGTALADMPGDLGLTGIQGTMDAMGMTQDGEPAPIPGAAELRTAIIAAAFQARPGDPPRLTEVATPSAGGTAYFALVIDDILPTALKPFDTVKEQVAEDWKADQQRRAQEEAASKMLAAVKGGQSFADAATVAGVTLRTTPELTRSQPVEGVAPEVQRAAFGLKPNDPTMLETADGFVVMSVTKIIEPDPKTDATGYDQLRTMIGRSIGADLSNTFVEALRQRANPRINQKNFDQIVQP